MEIRRRHRRTLIAIATAVLGLALTGGCRKAEPAKIVPMTVLVSEPYRALMEEEAEQYNSLYPAMPVVIRGVETREAIVHLLNDSVKAIAVDRPLNEEERAVAKQAGLHVTENAFAGDGLAVVVQKENPLEVLTLESARNIIAHDADNWKAVPESRRAGMIDLVLPGRNAGTPELLQKTILSLRAPVTPTTSVRDQQEALAYVAAHSNAVTFVSVLCLPGLPAGTKVVPIRVSHGTDSVLVVRPTQMDLYQSLYPFHYLSYLYTVESPAAVATGFSTFVVVTLTGQKIVQNAGLAPVKVPNRIIQLNPE